MNKECPYCRKDEVPSGIRFTVVKAGRFRRKSDCRKIQRFRCKRCFKYFSNATGHSCFRQHKRTVNDRLRRSFASGMSIRRMARELRLSRTTVDRKLRFLGAKADQELAETNNSHTPCEIIEFDDLETFEHTKCKPLSVTLAVEHKTRRILGFEISQMPAKGKLSRLSVKKYGPRPDRRAAGRAALFSRIQHLVAPEALIKSDENPHYTADVEKYFPEAKHERHKGQRGSIVGQGELKKIRFDPLFSLNHTCAMLRANINRLFRRTWCTTKNPHRLRDHIAIYAVYHNLTLLKNS